MQRTRVDANARYKERDEDAEATGRREAEPHQDAEDDLHRLFSESDGQVIRLITGRKGQKTDSGLKVEAREATDFTTLIWSHGLGKGGKGGESADSGQCPSAFLSSVS